MGGVIFGVSWERGQGDVCHLTSHRFSHVQRYAWFPTTLITLRQQIGGVA